MKKNQLQTMFLLTDKPIVSFNPKELKDYPLNVELFGDLPSDEYEVLKEDIQQRGIQDALHIVKKDKDYFVISGHQRKRIALELGINVPCIVRNDLKEVWQIEEHLISDNLLRRQLSDYQKVKAGERLEVIEKEKAKQRQIDGLKKGDKTPVKVNLPEREKGQSRDKVADKLGFSGSQYEKAKVVYEKATPEVKKEWKEQKISTHRAFLETTNKDKGMSEHSRKTLFSSDHDDWETPEDEYNKLDKEFKFDYDPCPLKSTFDGLKTKWKKHNFINPPYSNVAEFLKKGHDELNNGNAEILVYLIPVRTDTKWFHTYVYPYYKKGECEIRFIKGRLKFSNGKGIKNSAPFPSMEVIFRSKK